MAVASEKVVGFVLNVARARLQGIIPGDCSPKLCMLVAMLASVATQIWGKTTLFSAIYTKRTNWLASQTLISLPQQEAHMF